jgi:hypothetical protein
MYPNGKKRFYSPQFSEVSAVSVRRLAWLLGIPMPQAVDRVVALLPSLFASDLVCRSCIDKTKCTSCVFCQKSTAAVPAA